MSNPACRFFGGPFHDTIFEISDVVDEVELAQVLPVEHVTDDEPPTLSGDVVRYSRVYNAYTPTRQFEYIGRVR